MSTERGGAKWAVAQVEWWGVRAIDARAGDLEGVYIHECDRQLLVDQAHKLVKLQ